MRASLFSVIFLSITFFGLSQKPSHQFDNFSEDGAWCWFSDPRAIYVHGDQPGILSGWVKTDGTIESGLLNTSESVLQYQSLYNRLEEDDHDNPVFVELLANNFISFFTKHGDGDLYIARSNPTNASIFLPTDTINPITGTELEKYPRNTLTYANPFYLGGEKRLYCFGRWTGFKPNMIWSDDEGKTFSDAKVFITNTPFDPGNRPYVKYYSDGKDRIHITFTDGHPRNEDLNAVYYAYYEKGAFWKADGSKICNLDEAPFEPKDATLVYEPTEQTGRSWIYDIASNAAGDVVILYTRYPSEEEHIYHYAKFDGEKWIDIEITNAGKWFPRTLAEATEKEPHYSGGLTINPQNLHEIFVSEEVESVFEIIQYRLQEGNMWSKQPITKNSRRDNVRPFFPRNMRPGDRPTLLWMENEIYVHYTAYKSNIKYAYLD